jgi:hypothetical protein
MGNVLLKSFATTILAAENGVNGTRSGRVLF